MTKTDNQMSALLGSRICHDLISPLGAISNGVELLQMSGLGDSPELALITESVENANARIRLFRLAFGAASPGQDIGRGELLEILRPIGAARKLAIDWDPPARIPRDTARLVFLLLLCCETVLPYGGNVTVELSGERLHLVIEAARLRHEPELWKQVTEGDLALPQASEIHFPLARQAAADIGTQLDVTLGETRIELSA